MPLVLRVDSSAHSTKAVVKAYLAALESLHEHGARATLEAWQRR